MSRAFRGDSRSAAAERQIILYSACTAARRRLVAERADRLMTGMDWSRLAETLRRRRLLPTLGPRIVELSNGRASDGFRTEMEEAIAASRRHGVFLQIVTLRAMAMLTEAGIRSAALKGPLLGEAIYGDPGRRPCSSTQSSSKWRWPWCVSWATALRTITYTTTGCRCCIPYWSTNAGSCRRSSSTGVCTGTS